MSIWRFLGRRWQLSLRAASSSKLRGGAKPAAEGPPDDKVMNPRDSGPT